MLIILLLIIVVLAIILFKFSTTYKYYQLTEDKILFKRPWFKNPTFDLHPKRIKEIYYYTNEGKSLGFRINTLDNKQFEVSNKLDFESMMRFVLRHNLLFLSFEATHGGGVTTIYSPGGNK